MWTLFLIFHFIVAIALIILVMLQSEKSHGLAGAFGGGEAYTMFGYREGWNFVKKLTAIVAVIFLTTSLVIYVVSTKKLNQASSGAVEMPVKK